MKRCSTLIIGETQRKTTTRYLLTLVRMAIIKSLQIIKPEAPPAQSRGFINWGAFNLKIPSEDGGRGEGEIYLWEGQWTNKTENNVVK